MNPAPAKRCRRSSAAWLLPLLIACGSSEPKAADPSPSAEPIAKAPRAEELMGPSPRLITRTRPLMSTVFAIQVFTTDERRADEAIARAFDEIERLEGVLSEWQDESEIARINAAAGQRPVSASEDTRAVVRAGIEVSRYSQGSFDLSWAALRGAYDFRPGYGRIPTDEELSTRLEAIDWSAIILNDEKRTVFLRKSGMAIGTGGIAKGYALDRAGAQLREAGLESFMLFGGGQVQVHGMKEGRPWRVGVQHPRRSETYFGFVEATEGSISTSGDYEHAFIDASGRRHHHLIDPRTGRSAEASLSATVIAPEGLYSDALSTAVFILGPEKGFAMLATLPFEAAAIVVDSSCRLHMNGAAKERFALRMELNDGVLPDCLEP